MVSKFKLGHSVHVKMIFGTEKVFGAPLGAPQSFRVQKWDILENWFFNFICFLVICIGRNGALIVISYGVVWGVELICFLQIGLGRSAGRVNTPGCIGLISTG